MISKLIAEYQNNSNRLRLAIEANDNARVKELDKLVSSSWNSILAHNSTTENESVILAEFLIKQLIVEQAESDTSHQIGKKLIELISSFQLE